MFGKHCVGHDEQVLLAKFMMDAMPKDDWQENDQVNPATEEILRTLKLDPEHFSDTKIPGSINIPQS